MEGRNKEGRRGREGGRKEGMKEGRKEGRKEGKDALSPLLTEHSLTLSQTIPGFYGSGIETF